LNYERGDLPTYPICEASQDLLNGTNQFQFITLFRPLILLQQASYALWQSPGQSVCQR
jgi:hypothetical protein